MTANGICVRKYQPGEEKAIQGLIERIMADEFQEARGAYPTNDLTDISESYGKIGDTFFVAEDNGKIIGTVAIKKEDDRIALLRRLFVSPDYRNRHIGVQLIDRALEFCREIGYQELVFKTTSKMQGAIQLCQKKGFTQRAQIDLGDLELLKFTLGLHDGAKTAKSS